MFVYLESAKLRDETEDFLRSRECFSFILENMSILEESERTGKPVMLTEEDQKKLDAAVAGYDEEIEDIKKRMLAAKGERKGDVKKAAIFGAINAGITLLFAMPKWRRAGYTYAPKTTHVLGKLKWLIGGVSSGQATGGAGSAIGNTVMLSKYRSRLMSIRSQFKDDPEIVKKVDEVLAEVDKKSKKSESFEGLEGEEYSIIQENLDIITRSVDEGIDLVLSEEDMNRMDAAIQKYVRDVSSEVDEIKKSKDRSKSVSKLFSLFGMGLSILGVVLFLTKKSNPVIGAVSTVAGLLVSTTKGSSDKVVLGNMDRLKSYRQRLESMKNRAKDPKVKEEIQSVINKIDAPKKAS